MPTACIWPIWKWQMLSSGSLCSWRTINIVNNLDCCILLGINKNLPANFENELFTPSTRKIQKLISGKHCWARSWLIVHIFCTEKKSLVQFLASLCKTEKVLYFKIWGYWPAEPDGALNYITKQKIHVLNCSLLFSSKQTCTWLLKLQGL